MNRTTKQFFFIVFLLCSLAFQFLYVNAAEIPDGGKTLSGRVLDEYGEPLPGVAVYDASKMKDGVLTDERESSA